MKSKLVLTKEKMMFEVGTELLVNGVWMIVVAVEDGCVWAQDQDGEELEISSQKIEHIYE